MPFGGLSVIVCFAVVCFLLVERSFSDVPRNDRFREND